MLHLGVPTTPVHNVVHMSCAPSSAYVHSVVLLFEVDRKAAKSGESWAHVLCSHARPSQAAILGESVSLTLQHTLQQQAAILGESASLTGPEARAHGNQAEEVYEEALDIVNQQLGLEHPRSLVLKVPFSLLLMGTAALYRVCSTDGYCSTVQGLLDWFEVPFSLQKLTLQLEKHTHCILIHTPSRPGLLPRVAVCVSQGASLALSCGLQCAWHLMWPTMCLASCCELPVAALY